MRNIVKNLWDSILDPLNDERALDLISFFSLVLNGQISQDELKEIIESQSI